MRYIYLCLALFSGFLTPVWGQITVGNNIFPSAGDTLRIATATNATLRGVRVPTTGTNQTWDYSFVRSARNSTAYDTIAYESALTDTAVMALFPTADLVVRNSGQAAVFNKTTTRLELLGFAGAGFTGVTVLSIAPVFNPPVLERRAPLAYNTTNNNSSAFNVVFPSNALPDSLLAGLPLRPDSFRIRFQTTRQDRVDAWGTIAIPGATYPVLRERRREITETKIEIKVNPSPLWLDITTLVLQGAQRPRDTTVNYYFWSNTEKEPIAIITTDERDSVTEMQYKYRAINTNAQDLALSTTKMIVSPNPAATTAVVAITDSKAQQAYLVCHDVLGRLVWSAKDIATAQQQLSVDVAAWESGFYVLSLYTEGGGLLARQPLMVQH